MGRVEPWVGFKDIQLLVSDSQNLGTRIVYIHSVAVAKIGYNSVSAFATLPGRHLTGWVWIGSRSVSLNYRAHISYTHIPF